MTPTPHIRHRVARAALLAILAIAASPVATPTATAQPTSRPRAVLTQGAGSVVIPNARVVQRDQVLGIASGGLAGTYVRIANDLTGLFDAPDSRLRVLNIVGKGSLQNTSDLFNLTNVDIAIVQTDVLAFLRQNQVLTAANQSIGYIAKLYEEEVHILAAPGIASIADLAGKKVNFDTRGSGGAVTSTVVFGTLGIKPEIINDDSEVALAKLKRGDIAALVYVTGKPSRLMLDAQGTPGLHLLPVPLNAALLDTYAPTQLTHADYPGLVPDGETVDTVAVGAVLAVYNWPVGTQRYTRLARFTDQLFDNLGTLQQPGHHPKWKDVNLAAQVPGWTRLPAATQWLQRNAAAPAVAAAPTPNTVPATTR